MHEQFLKVVEKSAEHRAEFECQDLVSWFQNHCGLLEKLPTEIVADVIRNCEFERKRRDDVLIKQGESGDKLYIILKGAVSIYVVEGEEDPKQVVAKLDKVLENKHEFNRDNLGKYVWTAGEGKSFGEVALLKDDCIRTATVVADCDTDLVIIDRTLYRRSVKDVLENEFQQKVKFVEENTLFRNWQAKHKKQLVISLKKESLKFGCPLARQGSSADNIFFVINGEVEILCDQSQFKGQYEEWWKEMEALLPGLLPKSKGLVETPHKMISSRKQHKPLQMCLLGANEVVGALEILIGLKTSLVTSQVTQEADVLLLSKENYDRLFAKRYNKYAPDSLKALRERLTWRLYLYIHRFEIFDDNKDAPFLKFLSYICQDEASLNKLKRAKQKEKDEKEGRIKDIEPKKPTEVHAKLQMTEKDFKVRLPVVDSSQRVINQIEIGLKGFIEASRGNSPAPDGVRETTQRHWSFGGHVAAVRAPEWSLQTYNKGETSYCFRQSPLILLHAQGIALIHYVGRHHVFLRITSALIYV